MAAVKARVLNQLQQQLARQREQNYALRLRVPSVRSDLQFPLAGEQGGRAPKLNKTGVANPNYETLRTQKLGVDIHNARRFASPPTLAANGFQLMAHNTKVQNFGDLKEVQSIYYKEMEELVRTAFGAEKCILFDHTIRCVSSTSQDTATKAAGVVALGGVATSGVTRVHGDYTAAGAPRRVLGLSKGTYITDGQIISEEEAEDAVNNRRVVICNVL
jgi:hypothetical protein